MKTLKEGKTEIDVKRPNGNIETIDVTAKFRIGLNDKLFAQVVVATRQAGRGDVLCYRNIAPVVEIEEADYQTNCPRCGHRIDSRKSYGQKESYLGHQVMTYYCDDCRKLLSAIGSGEHTALEDKASHKPSPELVHKQDF